MTAIECLKILRKGFLVLLVWNLILSFCLVAGYIEKKENERFQKICNLESIPPYEILEEQ